MTAVHHLRAAIAFVIAWLVLIEFTSAQTPNPEFTHALPMAVQRGVTTDVTVFTYPNQKKGFDGAFAVLFQGDSVKAECWPRTTTFIRARRTPCWSSPRRATASTRCKFATCYLAAVRCSATSSL
jgi:hypothetical protein